MHAAALGKAINCQRIGRHSDALSLCDAILEQRPNHPLAAQIKSHALLALGYPEEALSFLEQVASRSPQNAEAQANLGILFASVGNLVEAATAFERAHKLMPSDKNLAFNLCKAWVDSGQPLKAIPLLHELCKDAQQEAEHLLLARALFDVNRHHEAISWLKKILQYSPENVAAWLLLGMTQLTLNQAIDAIFSLRSAVRISPNLAVAHEQLGVALGQLGSREEDLHCYQRALELEPNRISTVCLLAQALLHRGHWSKAESHLWSRISTEDTPDLIWVHLAEVYERQSRHSESLDCLSNLDSRLSDYGLACLIYARLSRRIQKPEEGLRLLDERLEKAPHNEKASLLHERGNCREALAQYTQAFQDHQAANISRRLPFDAPAHISYGEEIRQAYSTPHLTSNRASKAPLFVVGMPRSGTSLCEQILATHPQIRGGGEQEGLRLMLIAEATKAKKPLPYAIAAHSGPELHHLSKRLEAQCFQTGADEVRVTDKMPHNFLYLGAIHQLFPDATIVHCVRDPLDTILSCFFQNFHASLSFTCDLNALAVWFEEYHRMMAFWIQQPGFNIHRLSYEDLVSNPEHEIPRLLDAAGVPRDSQCNRFWENERVVTTASWDQVNKPLHTGSIGRSSNYNLELSAIQERLKNLNPL